MARKRVVEPSGVKTWEDANDALRQIAEAQLAVQDIEGEMNKQILGAKKAAEEQSKPHKDRIAKLERELKDFVTEHRADMGKAKSKILTFGEVGFRLSTSVSLPRAKEKIEEIVLGHPKNMDGTVGPRAEKCETLAKELEERTGLHVVLWDERRTTVAAHEILHRAGKKEKKHRENVDAVAATLILQGYLDKKRRG